MFLLGLLLPICYLAGFTGTAILTQWVVLSLVLPFALWREGPFTSLHGVGLVFLAYACASLLWVPNFNDSLLGLWHLLILALALWLGTTSPSLTQLWRGLALGLSISSLCAIAQYLGLETVYRGIGPTVTGYSGLLFNATVSSAATALVILALICERLWFYIPALIPGLYLSHSRGGYLILAIGLLAKYVHWTVALLILTLTGLLSVYFLDPSNTLRLQIWSVAYAKLTPLGWGIGSFYDIWYQTGDHSLIHPEFVHNDYLQLAFEFGWGALPAYILWAGVLLRVQAPTWPIAVGFATCMAFYFPLSCPLVAFIGCVVAGHLLREPHELRVVGRSSGSWLVHLNALWASGYGPYPLQSIPLPPRTQS